MKGTLFSITAFAAVTIALPSPSSDILQRRDGEDCSTGYYYGKPCTADNGSGVTGTCEQSSFPPADICVDSAGEVIGFKKRDAPALEARDGEDCSTDYYYGKPCTADNGSGETGTCQAASLPSVPICVNSGGVVIGFKRDAILAPLLERQLPADCDSPSDAGNACALGNGATGVCNVYDLLGLQIPLCDATSAKRDVPNCAYGPTEGVVCSQSDWNTWYVNLVTAITGEPPQP